MSRSAATRPASACRGEHRSEAVGADNERLLHTCPTPPPPPPLQKVTQETLQRSTRGNRCKSPRLRASGRLLAQDGPFSSVPWEDRREKRQPFIKISLNSSAVWPEETCSSLVVVIKAETLLYIISRLLAYDKKGGYFLLLNIKHETGFSYFFYLSIYLSMYLPTYLLISCSPVRSVSLSTGHTSLRNTAARPAPGSLTVEA